MARVVQQNGEIRVLLGRCKDCKYFKPHENDPGYGFCNCEKFVYLDGFNTRCKDGLMYWDYEEFGADFEVGENFGCIHFKPKRR